MFDKSTWIKLPRNVVVGHGVLDQVGAAVDDLYLSGQPLLVTSPTPERLAGDRLRAQFDVEPHTVTVDTASFDSVETVADTARAEEADYIIALGGGKAIDIAKMAAERIDCGFVSVPTAASHDGIVSGRSSIPEGDTRHSVAADPPLAVVADTELLAQAPWEFTTAGCADIISNYTAVKDWQLAHRLKNVEYSEYAGSSRPASGAEHLFSHQLDRLLPNTALHGHQVGVGAIMTEYLHSGEKGQWRNIRDALERIDAPTTARGLGVDDETVIEALTTAHTIRDRYTVLGDGMNEEAAREVARVTGVIEG